MYIQRQSLLPVSASGAARALVRQMFSIAGAGDSNSGLALLAAAVI